MPISLGDSEALARLSNARVLMIDDDPIITAVVQTFLEEAGYRDFTGEQDPERALQMIRDHRPDVVLLDLHMPGRVNGFSVLRALRRDPATQFLPVLVMTSASDARTKLRVLELGATDFLEKPVDASELALRLRNTLAFKAYRDRLEFFDPVTALPNRRMFIDKLTAELERAGRDSTAIALLQLGLDDFKRINASLGHVAGDQALQCFAERLLATIREPGMIGRAGEPLQASRWNVSRVDTDEFTVMLTDLRDVEDAAVVAKRIHARLAAPISVDGQELYLAAAIGVAGTPIDGSDAATLFQNGSVALAQARDRGLNGFAFCARTLDDSSRERLTLEAQLRRALERDEFTLFYQPKIDIRSGRVDGAEALIRWRHPTRGLLAPAAFIPIAEASELIVDVGVWVIEQACKQARAWQSLAHPISIALNISAQHLRDGRILRDVECALDRSAIDPRLLTVELTESSLMRDPDAGMRALAGLRAMGVRVSLDDFGTGYSSLSYLKRMPLDELKIDKTFIDDIPDDAQGAAIVSAIIAMAQTLKLKVVAEGVEQPSQLAFLQQHGCDAFQGFLCSRPVSIERFDGFVEDLAHAAD